MYHADLYRLDGPTDIEDIGLREILGGDGVAVIEWADKLEASLPAERLDITIAHQTEETRLITITPRGARYRPAPRAVADTSQQLAVRLRPGAVTCGDGVGMRRLALSIALVLALLGGCRLVVLPGRTPWQAALTSAIVSARAWHPNGEICAAGY